MRAILILLRYFKYRQKAKNRFKIHSPFAYGLIENVFRKDKQNEDLRSLDDFVKELRQSKRTLETTDFGYGAGDKTYNSYVTTLGKIVRKRSHPQNRLHLLYNLVTYLNPKSMLEFGTAAGISTMYLKKPLPDSKMITMEGCSNLAALAKENIDKMNVENVEVYQGDFDKIVDNVLKKFDKLDFVFFDGNHKKEPTLNYFNKCYEKSHNDSVFVFDDIHWSKGMEQAWEIIKADERVSVTMDIFWFGLVFFRSGIAKQDFVVKF
jgi:predicted O-methyltransferase YrrM